MLGTPAFSFALPDSASDSSPNTPTQQVKIRLSWGHRSPQSYPFYISLATNAGVAIKDIRAEGFEPEDRLEGTVCETRAGGGDVDALTFYATWSPPTTPPLKPHSIWQYLLDHGDPGQIARLTDDPGLRPDAPLLTVLTSTDGTRGFSVGLEQLARHKSMWLPAHDVFIALADAPVDFAAHLASLKGERVLKRIKNEPESTLAEWTNKWEDFGNPLQWNKPWETSWLGSRGHLTGTVARHESLYKFGVDRWAGVRPDLASPHRFTLDFLWPDSHWAGQRLVGGLPVIATRLERNGQHCEIEQFAAPLHETARAKRGDVPSVFFSRIQLSGQGPLSIGLRLATETANRHPELRKVAGRQCVVDRETGAIWLMVELETGLTLPARSPGNKDPQIELEIAGELSGEPSKTVTFKLPSPMVQAQAVDDLAALDFDRCRAATVKYWEDWLARGARFEAPESAVNDLFRANLWHALTLPRCRTDDQGRTRIDLPYSNFAYGQFNADWPINQAVYVDYMIYGLRGYFEPAAEEFAAMFETQQKPDGHIGGYADWGVYSPGMLYAIGQNFLLSRDRGGFERLLPAALKTLDWCLDEVERGKNVQAAPGLVLAPLNDLTHEARAWAFPNAYFVAGLDIFGRALAVCAHPRAAAAQAAARQMRKDVERGFAQASVLSPVVQLADGTWNDYVPTDALTPRRRLELWYPTDVDCGPVHLARLSAIDPRGWLASAMLDDHEDNLFLNQWGMANEPVYNQHGAAYLLRDEPEAAIRTFYGMMACAFSHHQLTPLEHRWAWGQYYMPPSTDGAWFELYRNLLLNELHGEDTLFIGQATPRAWLADRKKINVTGAPTWFGPISFEIASATAQKNISAQVQFATDRRPKTLLVRLRHPEKQSLALVTVNGTVWRDFDPGREWIRIPDPRADRYNIIAHY